MNTIVLIALACFYQSSNTNEVIFALYGLHRVSSWGEGRRSEITIFPALKPSDLCNLSNCASADAIFCLLVGSKLELMHCREHSLSLKLTLVIAHCLIFMLASLSHLRNILTGTFQDKVGLVTTCKTMLNAVK